MAGRREDPRVARWWVTDGSRDYLAPEVVGKRQLPNWTPMKSPSRQCSAGQGTSSIRVGRAEEQRTGMMTKMMQDISPVTSAKQENVWIYLCNLDPTDMIEFGQVLPAPGQEKAWFESLPGSLKTYLVKLGTTKANFKL
jgi:hypothetical protein